MDEKQFETISKKMDTIARLLSFDLVKNESVIEKQVEILTKAGLSASEIAKVIDKEVNQVYVTQTNLRKKLKKIQQKESAEQIGKAAHDV